MQTSSHFMEQLNERQRMGVVQTHGPLLVIAGAGSGKTKMLTARVAHLIEHHRIRPDGILAVTFTNKAAAEMKHRVASTLGLPADTWNVASWRTGTLSGQPLIGTFHSVCVRILRREMAVLPFTAPFQILDDGDQLSLVKTCFKQLDLNEKMFSPKSFQWAINAAKCAAQEPHEISTQEFDLYSKNLSRIYALYQQELVKSNSLDFGEIITMTYRLLRDHPEVLERYQRQFQFIHVDEYQDTNRAQYLVIRLLAQAHRNLCVVGDEDQSIYKWRGADIRNILDFEKDYPEAKVVKLEQNYRSTKTIIAASSRLISNNTERKNKTLFTENEEGEPISVVQVSDDQQEAEVVVRLLKEKCSSHDLAFNDVAIFYRTNAQSRVFEDHLRREKIPYTIVGGLKFYDRKEIKDLLAYFRVLANPSDSISAKRIVNVPARSIGKTSVEKIEAIEMAQGLPFLDAMSQAIRSGAITGAAARKMAEFQQLLSEWRALMAFKSLNEVFHEILDRTGYVQELKSEGTDEAMARVENLEELDTILADFERELRAAGITELSAAQVLPQFLETIALAAEQMAALEASAGGTVQLMTLHTSKGLEFPLVFMVGVEEGLFPSLRGDDGDEDQAVEEERRLCYVGMTRARRFLVMTHASARRVYGDIVFHEPSRFLDEIPSEYLDRLDLSRRRMGFAPVTRAHDESHWDQREVYSVEVRQNSIVGRRVKHQQYGAGTVRGSEGSGDGAKVTVEFAGGLTKKFILKFAQLEFLS